MLFHPNYPNQILTSYFCLSHIYVYDDCDQVDLLGVYGNLLNGESCCIAVEISFQTFYSLLNGLGDEAAEAIDLIAKRLHSSSDAVTCIDLTALGGVDIQDYVFSFIRTCDADAPSDDAPQPDEEDECPCYAYVGHLRKGRLLPDFTEWTLPETPEAKMAYYQQLLAARWKLYQKLLQESADPVARIGAGLTDEFLLVMAQAGAQMRTI